MRQVGILAAAALYAIEHNMQRLAEDHANARHIAEILADNPRVSIDPTSVHTNIIIFDINATSPDAATVVATAKEQGVLIFAFGPRTIRAVTHLDVTRDACERGARTLSQIIGR
jgi:threonine aldolase